MKKILLGTTALIGAVTLISGAALAGEDPKVTVGGFSTFEAGWTNSDNTQGEQTKSFRNDTEIHFNVAGKTDMGLGYGAEIDLEADINGAPAATGSGTNPGSSSQGIVAHRTYGWLQGDQWGHVEFGSNDGAASTLKIDASNIARASGGINGDWRYFASSNSTTGAGATLTSTGPTGAFAGGRQFITSANLPVENGPAGAIFSDTFANDTKITYYTPRFSGFQLGVSYAPDMTARGESTVLTDNISGDAKDVFSGGLNYESQFDQVGVAAAVTGESANANNTPGPLAGKLGDIEAWNAGLKLSYLGFSVAGSYGDWQDSLAVSGTKADYWTGGLAYETGPLGASVTYLGSEDKNTGTNDKFTNVSVGVDYKLAPGLTPFVEYTWFDIDATGGTAASGGVGEDKGNIILIGSQLSF